MVRSLRMRLGYRTSVLALNGIAFVVVTVLAFYQATNASGSSAITFETSAALSFAMLLVGFAAGSAVVLRLNRRRVD